MGSNDFKKPRSSVSFSEGETVKVIEGPFATFVGTVEAVSDKGKVKIGKPTIKGSKVTGEVLTQLKDDKVIVFKKKRRKGYKVKNGHRQQMTKILIKDIK